MSCASHLTGLFLLSCCPAVVLYARLLAVPLVMSYHTHIPEYIPRYTWSGLVQPMWSIIRWCTRRADLTLVTSKAMKVRTMPQGIDGCEPTTCKAVMSASNLCTTWIGMRCHAVS